jgi:hypothetical protein
MEKMISSTMLEIIEFGQKTQYRGLGAILAQDSGEFIHFGANVKFYKMGWVRVGNQGQGTDFLAVE